MKPGGGMSTICYSSTNSSVDDVTMSHITPHSIKLKSVFCHTRQEVINC